MLYIINTLVQHVRIGWGINKWAQRWWIKRILAIMNLVVFTHMFLYCLLHLLWFLCCWFNACQHSTACVHATSYRVATKWPGRLPRFLWEAISLPYLPAAHLATNESSQTFTSYFAVICLRHFTKQMRTKMSAYMIATKVLPPTWPTPQTSQLPIILLKLLPSQIYLLQRCVKGPLLYVLGFQPFAPVVLACMSHRFQTTNPDHKICRHKPWPAMGC